METNRPSHPEVGKSTNPFEIVPFVNSGFSEIVRGGIEPFRHATEDDLQWVARCGEIVGKVGSLFGDELAENTELVLRISQQIGEDRGGVVQNALATVERLVDIAGSDQRKYSEGIANLITELELPWRGQISSEERGIVRGPFDVMVAGSYNFQNMLCEELDPERKECGNMPFLDFVGALRGKK